MWVELALEEYKALRAEVLTTMQTQQGTLTFGTAAVGILAAGGFNVWKDELAATLVFLLALPLLSKLVVVIWMGEVVRMMRAGRHLQELEVRFASAYPEVLELGPVMRWETSLRDPEAQLLWRRHYEWNYAAIVLLFWLIAVTSVGLGVYRGTHGGLLIDNAYVWLIGGAILTLTLIGVYFILRQLAIVCRSQSLLHILARKRINEQPDTLILPLVRPESDPHAGGGMGSGRGQTT
jgi:hypothetical protein